jgi:endonuclease YncB( thermonuclease family)
VKDVLKKTLYIALLGALVAFGAHAADKKWSRLEGCRYLEHKNNDGDSFLVQCGKEKFFARFYFVDAPEAYANVASQLQEQYEYFGVTMDEATRAGGKARDRVQSLLAVRPFVVHTRKAHGQGRSGNARYLSLVEVDGRYVHEVLLSEGLARAKGTPTTLPTGQKSKDYVPALRRLEDEARTGRRGLWSTSVASRRAIRNSPL